MYKFNISIFQTNKFTTNNSFQCIDHCIVVKAFIFDIIFSLNHICLTNLSNLNQGMPYRNFSLGLAIKARACEGAGQEWSPWITFHAPESVRECEGLNPHTPKLESWWIPESSESDFRDQNPLDWKVHYIIGKILEYRCLKWARMVHLYT
jgi:hypothetical protein